MRLLIRVGTSLEQKRDDVDVALVGGYHEARVVVFVGDVDVGRMIGQVFDNVQPTIKTRRSQRSGVGPGQVVHIGFEAH